MAEVDLALDPGMGIRSRRAMGAGTGPARRDERCLGSGTSHGKSSKVVPSASMNPVRAGGASKLRPDKMNLWVMIPQAEPMRKNRNWSEPRKAVGTTC